MYLMFEVGGTKTRIGFSSNGQTIEKSEIISSPADFSIFLNILKEKAQSYGKIDGIGGGLPVVFDKDRNKIIQCAHLKNWIGVNAKDELEKAFGAPAILDNETSMSALGEALQGAGKDYPIVAYVAVGTGVGGARIVDGQIDKKAFGFEIGHQIIMADGDQCVCGGKGHLEAYIGGAYLEKKYGQKGENISDPDIWDEVARNLSIGLYNCSTHWSPDVFVLGGSVMQSIPLEKVKSYLKEFSTIFPQPPEVKLVSLGEQNGIIGALQAIKSLK